MEYRVPLFFVPLLLSFWPISPATGFVFDDVLAVYSEDFEAETTFPTTPELDVLAAGGLTDGWALDGRPPVLTGGEVHLASAASGTGGSFVQLPTGLYGEESIGLRVGFDDLSLQSTASGEAIASASFGAVFVRAAVNLFPSLVSPSVHLAIDERLDDGTVLGTSTAPLTNAEAIAILGGSAFQIDIEIDRQNAEARLSIQIDGIPGESILPTPLGLTAAVSGDLTTVGAGLTVFGSGGPADPDETLDLTHLDVFEIVSTTFIVDSTVDETDALIDGICDDGSGQCTLRAAIQESNAAPGAGLVIVPDGVFELTLGSAGEDAAAEGDLDLRDDLVLRGAGRNQTIVDGTGLDRVFEIPADANQAFARLLDLTLRGGFAGTSGSATGGGIQNWGRLQLAHCIVEDNRANLGGGVMNRGILELDDCIVRNNEAENLGITNASGGGVVSPSTSAGGLSVTATIRHTAIVNNIAPIVGGLELGNGAFVRVENTTVSGNSDTQVRIFNTNAVLQHVTLVGQDNVALDVGSFDGSHTLELANIAIQGGLTSACRFLVPAVMTTYSGTNASSDSSCSFSGVGDIENVALGLSALSELGESMAHVPIATSPLIDAADIGFCLGDDQVGTARPVDGNASGTAECDLGAIETPEPGFLALLGSGIVATAALARHRRRSGEPRTGDRRPLRQIRASDAG